jgi:hypothetical protein
MMIAHFFVREVSQFYYVVLIIILPVFVRKVQEFYVGITANGSVLARKV